MLGSLTQRRLLVDPESFDGKYELSCRTEESPLVKLVRNDTSGLYTIVGNVTEDELASDKVNVRRRRQTISFFSGKRSSTPPIQLNNLHSARRLEQVMDDPGAVLYGRECPCSPVSGAYCPEGIPSCKVAFNNTNRTELEISCTSETEKNAALFLFALAVFLFFFFGCLCLFSPKGRYSWGYFQKLICCYSEERYKQALNQELNRMARRNYVRQRAAEQVRRRRDPNRVYIPGNAPELPVGAGLSPDDTTGIELASRKVVVLKTRTFQEDDERPETGGETDYCAICLIDFENGDRVGDVRCGHIFHVDCLKSWIQRKNHCPLCHENELATPQEDRATVVEEGSNRQQEQTASDSAE